MTKTPSGPRDKDKLDPVWKALADPTRRAILDLLRDQPRTTTEIVDKFPHLTRFGVMKHLDLSAKPVWSTRAKKDGNDGIP